jgi:type II secretion system protein G
MKKYHKYWAATLTSILFVVSCFIYYQRGIETLPKTQVLVADLKPLSMALAMYRLNTGDYPSEDDGLSALITRPASLETSARWVQFLPKLPTDPWGNPYVYERTGEAQDAIVRIYSTSSRPDSPDEYLLLASRPSPDN